MSLTKMKGSLLARETRLCVCVCSFNQVSLRIPSTAELQVVNLNSDLSRWIIVQYFPATQDSYPWIDDAFCLFKDNVKKSFRLAGSGGGRLLLVSSADVMGRVPSFNLQFCFALAQVSSKWPLSYQLLGGAS